MTIKIKKLNENAIIPTYGSAEAAGCDLYALLDTDEVVIHPGETELVHTGISVEIQSGYYGGIYARSGLASKKGLRPANCTGVIDADYRGEIMVALHNDSSSIQTISNHERIAQLIIEPYRRADFLVVDDLADTERGEGGFGSTGK
jgi:dUTP pyrophosphatase